MSGLLLLVLGCRAVLEPRVPPPDDDPSDAWSAVLSRVVTPDGFVDYDALEADRAALDAYVAWLAKPRPNLSRTNARHAFWLNAYNALVLYGVLADGRPASVLDVDGWLPKPGSGFFYERAFRVDGHPVSLWEIEHEHLRFKVLDFRDHAALNCASASCPPLRPELYANSGLSRQLDDQMMRWVNDDDRGVRVEGDEAVFSPVFDWYGYDFSFQTGGDDLCTVVSRYAVGDRKQRLRELARLGCPHRFSDYDWSLNEARGRTVRAASDLPAWDRKTLAGEPEEDDSDE